MTPDPKAVEAERLRMYFTETLARYTNAPRIPEVDDVMARYVQALIKSSNLALLKRVEEEVIGEDDPGVTDEDASGMRFQDYDDEEIARNKLRTKQRQKLSSLRKEYER